MIDVHEVARTPMSDPTPSRAGRGMQNARAAPGAPAAMHVTADGGRAVGSLGPVLSHLSIVSNSISVTTRCSVLLLYHRATILEHGDEGYATDCLIENALCSMYLNAFVLRQACHACTRSDSRQTSHEQRANEM